MKKLFKVLSVVVMAFATFAATLAPMTQVSAKEKVTVWAWDPNFNIKALEIARDIYLKDNPDFDLDIVESAQNDIVQRLNTSLSSGVTEGLPDIVLIEDYRAQSFLTAFPDAFVPLDDYYNKEDFADYKVQATTANGKSYGVPFDTGVTGLYIRKDLLEEAGYTLEDVTNITWRELAEIGKKIKETTDVKLLSMDLNDLGLIRAMINASGAWYTKEDGVTPWIADNEALKEAFTVFKEMYDADIVNIHSDWAQMLQAFNGGKVATVPQGNWITPSVVAQEDQAGKWAVVPWPKQDNVEGSVNASNLGGSSFYVLNTKNSEAAAKFIGTIIGGSKEFYEQAMNEIGVLGTYTPMLETDVYNQEVDYFGGQQIYKDFAQWAEQIPSVNYGSHTYAVEDILKNALQQYLSGGDLDQILKDAQTQAENQLN